MTNLPRPSVVVAIAKRDITRQLRSRLIIWITAMMVLFWLSASQLRSKPETALPFASGLMFLAVVFLTAGVVSESLASGAAMLDRLHGVTALETVLGSAVGAAGALAPSFLISAVVALMATSRPQAGPVAIMLLWIAVATLAFVAAAVLLGVLIPSAGNAIVLAPFVLFGGVTPAMLPVDSLPPVVASGIRGLWSVLPLEFQANAMRTMLLMGGDSLLLPPIVLLLSIPLYLSLAAVALHRQQPAARWKQ